MKDIFDILFNLDGDDEMSAAERALEFAAISDMLEGDESGDGDDDDDMDTEDGDS